MLGTQMKISRLKMGMGSIQQKISVKENVVYWHI